MTRHYAFLLLPIVLIGALVTGCTVDPAKTDAYQKLDKKVKDLDEKTKRDIESLSIGLMDVREEVKNLPAKIRPDATVTNQLAAAVERINTLDQEVKKLSEALSKKETASPVRAASAADKAISPGAAKPAARSSAPAPAPAKGSYYQVKEGDTLQSIAKAHNVTAAEICRANNLPLTAVPHVGSPLFIPSK